MKAAEAEVLGLGFWRVWVLQKLGLEIIGSQFLETHLERIRDPAGTRKSIRVSRSSLLATVSADDEETKTWADFFRIFLFFVSTLFFILTD